MSLKKFQSAKKKKKTVQVNIITHKGSKDDDFKRKSLNMFDVKNYSRRMVKLSDIIEAKQPYIKGTQERKVKVKKKKIKKNKSKKLVFDKPRNDSIL